MSNWMSSPVDHPSPGGPRGVARQCHGSPRCMYAGVCRPPVSVWRSACRQRDFWDRFPRGQGLFKKDHPVAGSPATRTDAVAYITI